MTKNLAYYVNKFANLRVSRSSGVAPNKPILLLSIIELISQGEIRRNQIPLSAELIATFLKLWSHLEPVRKPDIGLPFYHLTSDGFWHYQMKLGFESLIAAKLKIRTTTTIRETVEYAYLDDELWSLLQNESDRTILTHTLINSCLTSVHRILSHYCKSTPLLNYKTSCNAPAVRFTSQRS